MNGEVNGKMEEDTDVLAKEPDEDSKPTEENSTLELGDTCNPEENIENSSHSDNCDEKSKQRQCVTDESGEVQTEQERKDHLEVLDEPSEDINPPEESSTLENGNTCNPEENSEKSCHSDKCEEKPEQTQSVIDKNDEVQTDQESKNDLREDEPLQKTCPEDPLENHFSNSNESLPETATSHQDKQKLVGNMTGKSVNEKREHENFVSGSIKPLHDETDDIGSKSPSDDGSVVSVGPTAQDTVSIDSDSDEDYSSHGRQIRGKINDVIVLEHDNGPHSINGDSVDSVQEIYSDNDDCVVTDEIKSNSNATMQRQRSTRNTKRIRYDIDSDSGDDDESDVEEVEMNDPLGGRTLPIPVTIKPMSNVFNMNLKKRKLNNLSEKKAPALSASDDSKSSKAKGRNSDTKILQQSIEARGISITPVSTKASTASQSSPQPPQPPILPSLTDDMFVVEAPSFIVPYVYEKPSLNHFREFVDKFGKELEEQRAKEEKERLEKEREEKEKRKKDRMERKERGEEVSASEDEEEEKKKKKAEKKERRRRKNEDDDVSWDGESSSESDDDETMSDEEAGKVEADSINEIKEVTNLPEKVGPIKSDSYFDCTLGKFFVNIGLSLVQEHVQTDLLKTQSRKLAREKKKGQNTKETQVAIASLMKNLEFSKYNNAPYSFTMKKCEFCSFKTESLLTLNHHLETPHMKNNLYKCNFCEYEIKSPHDILTHMEIKHQIRGKLERAPSAHQCINCPFEDNGKGKLARHQVTCAKKYKPDQNLAPPIEWEPPAKIPKISRAKNTMMGYGTPVGRQMGLLVRPPIPGAAGSGSGGIRARARPQVPPSAPRARANAPVGATILPNYGLTYNGKPKQPPSLSITPLPRLPQPAPTLPPPANKNTFVICEICDGYIKDLEQLRNHMQWIHKVKIHPKMIYNRPPLNCQKCQFRFFTDQGLERHLLGSHGLVTSSMQEAANKGKDAGRCPVCGRVYQWKLVNHVARDHNLTIKPAYLSYKCTVCAATFGMYKQFENHVYSAHSVVAKRVMEKNKPTAPASTTKQSDKLKSLKINDEITIIPQPAKSATSTKKLI